MKSKWKKLPVVLIGIIAIAVCGCSNDLQELNQKRSSAAKENTESTETVRTGTWETAAQTPYGAYPELVTYTLGQMSGANNSNLPDGNTYDDNAYTRYLRKMLNIQNKSVYMEREDQYDEFVNILVKDQTLPDVLVVSDRETLKELVDNDLVEDLSEVYENCTSERIKEMFESYGSGLLDSVRFNGKLMAIPETVTDHGPRLMWLRKDWMDKLGLEDPKTLEDAFDIVEKFVQNKMGTEDGEDPIGLACDTDLVGTTSSNYSVDSVFDKFGASPQRWVNQNGKIVYGSVTEETKNALSYLHELYERGVLDKNFALRAQNNLRDLVINGKCGAFFGLWWTPNNPLMDVYETDKEANWQPFYLQSTDWQNVYDTFQDNKYVVVRKGYEHPEIVAKYVSAIFDQSRYANDASAREVNDYFSINVDPTARPLNINVDYEDALYRTTEHIQAAFDKTLDVSELSGLEKSYYDTCKSFLNGQLTTANGWAAYASRIEAVGELQKAGIRSAQTLPLENVNAEIPQELQELENEAFLQIISGEKPVDYFDTFVVEWYANGGKELTEQIQNAYESGKD